MNTRANQMSSWAAAAAMFLVAMAVTATADFWAYPTPNPPEAVRLANTWSQMPR